MFFGTLCYTARIIIIIAIISLFIVGYKDTIAKIKR